MELHNIYSHKMAINTNYIHERLHYRVITEKAMTDAVSAPILRKQIQNIT